MNPKEVETSRSLDNKASGELPSPLKILDLFKIGSIEQDELRKQIENQEGRLDILVHPYFEPHLLYDESATKYDRQRNKFIKDALANRKPLIILEDERSKADRAPYLRRRYSNGQLYVVPTYHGASIPILPEHEAELSAMSSLDRDMSSVGNELVSWDYFGDILKKIGVKRIQMGGRYLIIREKSTEKLISSLDGQIHVNEWLKENKIPSGCVGTAGKELARRGIDVFFSSVTDPSAYRIH
jgi:hypothetical protein